MKQLQAAVAQGDCCSCGQMAFHEEDAEALLRSPLLAVACPDDVPTTEEPANVKIELRGLLLLSAPVMVQLSAQYAVTVVNQYFIGHQGAGPLAAAAIGNTVNLNPCSSHCTHHVASSVSLPDTTKG